MEATREELARGQDRMLYRVMLGVCALLAVCAVVAEPGLGLLRGFWAIQVGEAGLITDPIVTGGLGGALLNAAVLLLVSTLSVRQMKLPFTGLTFACLFMMAGFALLGKNILNSAPILAGGWLYAKFKREPYAKYAYLTMFGTCLAPLSSFLLHYARPELRVPAMIVSGLIVGFLVPPVSGFTVRVHQGYNLYNVGFSAGIVGLGLVSVLKGLGVTFFTTGSWSEEIYPLLYVMMAVLLLGLLGLGIWLGCRSPKQYRAVLRHSGRAVADFVALDGPGTTLVNAALTGAIGLLYLVALGVPLNGPLICCVFAMIGFGAFGKHPKNVIPVMVGAVLATVLMQNIPTTAPGVLLATLLCTGLAPVAGQFGPVWGAAAGFLHMCIVQNTAALHGGMNLYNNGFAAGLTCVLLVPVIQAVRPQSEE